MGKISIKVQRYCIREKISGRVTLKYIDARIVAISSPTRFQVICPCILNTIKRWMPLFREFEDKRKHKLNSEEWQIDDTPQIFPKSTKNSRCIWITNVLAVEPRY